MHSESRLLTAFKPPMVPRPERIRAKNVVAVVAAAAILVAARALPVASGLTVPGQTIIGILLAGVVLWITEAVPLPVTALLMLVLMPLLGVCSFSDAYANSIGSTAFFIMGTFAFTAALDATSVPTRVVALVLRVTGTDSKKILFGFMLACALLSTIMSDVAACGVFISVGKRLLELNGAERGKSALGKALMIAIPWASYAGGAASLSGNGCNVLTASLFGELFGTQISFVQWLQIGTPVALALLVTAWAVVVVAFRPEPISEDSVRTIVAEVDGLGKAKPAEVRTVAVILAAIVFWILSSWVDFFNTAMVAVVAMCLLFVPGMNPLPYNKLIQRMNWGVVLMIMCILSVGHFVVETGAGNWMVEVIVGITPEGLRQPLVMLLIASATGAVLHNLIPVGPAVAGILAFPLGMLAQQFGIPMTVMLMTVAWQASFSYILPLDCVPVLTYQTGYYKMGEYMRAGIVPTLVIVVLTVTLLPFICTLLGMG